MNAFADGCSTHDYSIYGLHVRSEIPLPELTARAPEEPDAPLVTIRYGNAGSDLPPQQTRPIYRAGINDYRHDLPGTARYRVRDGSEVIVSPCEGCPEDLIRFFLLGTGLAVLCHQRGLLPLHASAIDVDGRGVAFVGSSCAGKSTLLAFFHERGYRAVTDDVCVISFDAAGTLSVWPGVPRIKLRRGPDDVVKAEFKTRNRTSSSIPLHSVYALPEPQYATGAGIERLTAAAAFAAVFDHTFRPHVVAPMGRMADHFARCVAIAERVPIYAARWRRGADRVRSEAESLERHIRGR